MYYRFPTPYFPDNKVDLVELDFFHKFLIDGLKNGCIPRIIFIGCLELPKSSWWSFHSLYGESQQLIWGVSKVYMGEFPELLWFLPIIMFWYFLTERRCFISPKNSSHNLVWLYGSFVEAQKNNKRSKWNFTPGVYFVLANIIKDS